MRLTKDELENILENFKDIKEATHVCILLKSEDPWEIYTDEEIEEERLSVDYMSEEIEGIDVIEITKNTKPNYVYTKKEIEELLEKNNDNT